MELGADDYVIKPFKTDKKTNTVKIRFEKQELLNEVKNKNNVTLKGKGNQKSP